MASDIKNTADGITGNQVIGRVTVNTGGRGTNGSQGFTRATPNNVTIPLADIHDKYDDRFDDPRYYQGDSAT